MTICASPCHADPFSVTVQITAYLACAGILGMCFGFSGLVACWHAGFVRTELTTERVTLYVAICVCNVLVFRDWSRARMLVSLERIFRLLFVCAMFWVFVIGRVLACGFRSNGSYYRKGHALRCYLRVHRFSFSGLVA